VQACPVEAISRDPQSGLVAITSSKCTGCGQCLGACPWRAPVFTSSAGIAKICDLCQDDPLCVKFCQPGALRNAEKTSTLRFPSKGGKE
jgi:Fe-S-cluster-containing dehydrogenase component